MAFQNVIGQEKAKTILTRAFEQQRIPHAYLFTGGEGVGKEALALELAKALLCTANKFDGCDACSHCLRISKFLHPDVIYIFPAPTGIKVEEELQVYESLVANPYRRVELWANPQISIDRIRELKRKASLKSFEGRGRVVIVADAQQMTTEAANSLLKILEEPPEKMHLILVTSHLNQLLETIISRCQLVRFSALAANEIEQALITREKLEPHRARVISRIAAGNYRRALELIDSDFTAQREFVISTLRTILKTPFDRLLLVEELVKEKDKVQLKELLDLMLLWFRDALIYDQYLTTKVFTPAEIMEKITHIDEVATLEKFVQSMKALDYDKIIKEIENAIDLINRNVNITLIMIVLFDRLEQYLRRK
ncbi:DNA polymerase III subunit delta' [candidate division KSB1 bacterium]|nr:DNA polymerase III subunit delta' [candidate division KSB1 bacterium]